MLDWLRFIAEFILGMIKSVTNLLPMLAKAVGMIHMSAALAPPFLSSIMLLMLAVIIIMWVVNIF